jgi:hypothetical protein
MMMDFEFFTNEELGDEERLISFVGRVLETETRIRGASSLLNIAMGIAARCREDSNCLVVSSYR